MSYTQQVAEMQPMANFRRATAFMPTSKAVDALCAVLSVPYGFVCGLLLWVPGFLMLPFFLLQKYRGAHANRSNDAGGSLSAIKTLGARAAINLAGFGPDTLAPRLMGRMSLTGSGRWSPGWFYSHLYLRSIALGFKVTRRLWVEQVMRMFIGETLRFTEFSYLHLRTCYLDDVVARFVQDLHGKGGQLVILGAGYDTRCLRLPLPSSITRFEVDAPGTQSVKRALLREVGIEPTNVHYVPCDFAAQDWLVQLREAGFDPALPACFIWEGVTMYLPPAVVEATLRKVNTLPQGSVIAFDAVDAKWAYNPFMQKVTARAGEAWLFGIVTGQERAFVEQAGLQCFDVMHFESLLERYMPRDAHGHTLAACRDFGAFIAAGPAA